MENSITAAVNGIVIHLYVAEDDLVEANTQMISLKKMERQGKLDKR